MLCPFHLAIPCRDLEVSRQFYQEVFGCSLGRQARTWIDLNFFGHQLVLHHVAGSAPSVATNPVDADDVPVPHFGVVLGWDAWHACKERVQDRVSFVVPPKIRFVGEVGEQATMFFFDPSGNAIEIKAMRDSDNLFAAFP